MKTIIHVSRHWIPPEIPDYLFSSWPARVAKHTLECTNEFHLECWFPDRRFQSRRIIESDGIVYRLFPSLGEILRLEISPDLIRALVKKIVGKREELLFYVHGLSYPLPYTIYKFSKSVPVIAQDHGDHPPMSMSIRTALKEIVEGSVFKNIDIFYVLTKEKKDYLMKYRDIDSTKIFISPMGVDFEEFAPINKEEARCRIGLPLEKKIVLYVGSFYREKKVDLILRAHDELKKHNIEVVLVGGSEKDELYEDVVKSGVRFFRRVPHKEMNVLFSAADVYLFPSPLEWVLLYGGTSVAAIEALACGVPVVGAALRHFPAPERESVGRIPNPNSVEDIIQKVLYVLENHKEFKKCRKIARKYYDFNVIIKKHLGHYHRLFEEYY
jgi:glycosyltransferase involved in cell wall biosynthesis